MELAGSRPGTRPVEGTYSITKKRSVWQRPALVRMDAADAENRNLIYRRDAVQRQMGVS